MKNNDQLRALIDAYTDLAQCHCSSERCTMEALLDIFDAKELADLGYRERVIAYLKEYGCDEEIEEITK